MKKTTCLYALALIISFGMTQAAWAQRGDGDWHNNDRDGRDGWRNHAREANEWHHRHWHNGRVIYDQNEPYVTYAPPVIVQPPPPVYDYNEDQPGVNIVVPLNIH